MREERYGQRGINGSYGAGRPNAADGDSGMREERYGFSGANGHRESGRPNAANQDSGMREERYGFSVTDALRGLCCSYAAKGTAP